MRSLAKSLSGHDKGQYYVIMSGDDAYVYLADGHIRTIDRPKKKNRKHIQQILDLPEEVSTILQTEMIRDTEVKRALKLWLESLTR